MILRILGEGQLEVSDDSLLELNELDDVLIAAVEKGDEAQFQNALTNLVNKVRAVGKPVADDYIGPSEYILPGPDATLGEVQELLSDEGLIPG
ncbi:MAG: PspA-associated protein PspAA [Acidimicrobiia bacterium]